MQTLELFIANTARKLYLSTLRFSMYLNKRRANSVNLQTVKELNETENVIQNMIDDATEGNI